MALTMHPSLISHPGEWLRTEIVEAHGFTNLSKLAPRMGVTRQALSALLNGRAGLSAEMAIRFEKAFGVKADTMLRMQSAYDLAQARRNAANIRVDRLEPVALH
jgi:addiction module HigA family antidote